MTNLEAYAILEDALNRLTSDNMQTPAVREALKHLYQQGKVKWPFRQFWDALVPREGEMEYRTTGRWQMANAALNGIRLRVPESL